MVKIGCVYCGKTMAEIKKEELKNFGYCVCRNCMEKEAEK